MTKDEALDLALEALKLIEAQDQGCGGRVTEAEAWRSAQSIARKAIAAIKQAIAAPVQRPVADELVHARLKAQLWKNEAIVWKNAYDVERGFSDQDRGVHYEPTKLLSDEELVFYYNTVGGHLNSLRALEGAILKKMHATTPPTQPAPDLSKLKPENAQQMREWIADGSFTQRAIDTMFEMSQEITELKGAQQ